jgi:hypothetical protein
MIPKRAYLGAKIWPPIFCMLLYPIFNSLRSGHAAAAAFLKEVVGAILKDLQRGLVPPAPFGEQLTPEELKTFEAEAEAFLKSEAVTSSTISSSGSSSSNPDAVADSAMESS